MQHSDSELYFAAVLAALPRRWLKLNWSDLPEIVTQTLKRMIEGGYIRALCRVEVFASKPFKDPESVVWLEMCGPAPTLKTIGTHVAHAIGNVDDEKVMAKRSLRLLPIGAVQLTERGAETSNWINSGAPSVPWDFITGGPSLDDDAREIAKTSISILVDPPSVVTEDREFDSDKLIRLLDLLGSEDGTEAPPAAEPPKVSEDVPEVPKPETAMSAAALAAAEYIKSHPGCDQKTAAKQAGIKESTFRRHIWPELKRRGFRIGDKKHGCYPPNT